MRMAGAAPRCLHHAQGLPTRRGIPDHVWFGALCRADVEVRFRRGCPAASGGSDLSRQEFCTAAPVRNDTPVKATAAEMIRSATELVPVLEARAENCEQLRFIPDDTLKDFISSGIIRIYQPVAYGGLGLDMDTVLEVAMELGRGCGSSAWLGSFWPLHNWMVGMWSKQ